MNKLTISTTTIIAILIFGTVSLTANLSQNISAYYPTKNVTGIEISDIKTSPIFVTVGNNFKINATVTNSSPNTIKFVGPECGNSPIAATFDKNVRIHPSRIMTCLVLQIITLHPGEKAMVTGPNAHSIYTTSGVGTTKSNVTFKYTDEQGKIQNNVTKPFVFVISILKTTK